VDSACVRPLQNPDRHRWRGGRLNDPETIPTASPRGVQETTCILRDARLGRFRGEAIRLRKNVANIYVIDPSGRIVKRFTGAVSNEALRDLFRAIDAAIADSEQKDRFDF
jgi:hypothetical protein